MTNAQAVQLLPCPFCGGEAHIERYGDRRQSTQYACDACGCSLETGEEWGHGAGWNKRAARATSPMVPDSVVLAEENDMLRARLRSVTDTLASVLEHGLPAKGRSVDDREAYEVWIEDAVARIQGAYAALAGMSLIEWRAAHPGLYSPPPGPIVAPETEGTNHV